MNDGINRIKKLAASMLAVTFIFGAVGVVSATALTAYDIFTNGGFVGYTNIPYSGYSGSN